MTSARGGDDRERALRAAWLARGPLSGHACPPAEALWSAARGDLAPAPARALIGHLATCASCAEDWCLAQELTRQVPPVVTFGPHPSRWRGGLAALAASACAALLALTIVLVPRGPAPSLYRAEDGRALRSLVPERPALPRASFRLRWSKAPAGARYDVRVATEALDTLASARNLEAPEYVVPEAALQGVPRGARVLWQVEVLLPDGRRASSPTFVALVE